MNGSCRSGDGCSRRGYAASAAFVGIAAGRGDRDPSSTGVVPGRNAGFAGLRGPIVTWPVSRAGRRLAGKTPCKGEA